jgi:hypothetical protein
MSDKLDLHEEDYLLAETVIKLTAIERLLVKSGILTSNAILDEMKVISQELIDVMLKHKNSKN